MDSEEKGLGQQKEKINSQSPSSRRTDYGYYRDKDLSVLSPREREVIMLKIDGLTYRQIAVKLGVQTGCVGVLLQKARLKLDGAYHDGLRLELNRRRHESILRNPEREKENKKRSYLKHRDRLIANMKEYNKQYYQKHREEILRKQKERDRKKRENAI